MTAIAVTIVMAAQSWLAIGTAAWQAFVHWMSITSHAVLGQGIADWNRLQSLFSFVRAHGGMRKRWPEACKRWLWRSCASFELKAAALGRAALLATPYLYTYDLVVLAIPVAFLLRLALTGGFLANEIAGLITAGLLLLGYPYLKIHIGLAATSPA